MGFIEFPFIEVPKDLRKIVGKPTPGTRAYRREGTHVECGQWLEDLGLHYKGDVGISPAGVTMFVPVQRAAVHKRIKEGKLRQPAPAANGPARIPKNPAASGTMGARQSNPGSATTTHKLPRTRKTYAD
jgi:hypothetical protein